MKNLLKNNRFAVFIILTFLIYVMSNGEWCIPVFAWIYPILFLHMLSFSHTRKVYLIIGSIYAIGFIFQFKKAIGMDIKICIVAALLVSFLKVLPYIYWSKSKMKFQDTVIFASIMVSIEYIIYLIYPILGGLSDAYTQYQNLYLLQIVTVTGIYGITFLILWTAAVVIWIWNNKSKKEYIKKYIAIYCSVTGLIFAYGIIMFHFVGNSDKSVRIAGVTVPILHLLNNDKDIYSTFYTNTFTDENITNTRNKLLSVADGLFLKTELEAQAGAKIVFWSELNGAVLKQDEDMLLQRASDIAKQEEIYLIVSLLVKTPYVDLKENKTVAFNPQGELISEYFKHGRSIGELCQKGDGILKSSDTEYGRIAPFICSDMAFLSKIQQAGKNNVDILIVPASDWKEMTLLATKTAVVRGVENGINIIRHTNNGMSVVSDFKGSMLAQTSYFQSDTKTLSAQVITKGRFTLYSYIGNLFVYLCNFYLIGSFILPKIKRLRMEDFMCKFTEFFKYWGQLFFLPLYWLSFLFPRNKRIWLFGSTFGKRFADNPKYLFLYMSQHKQQLKIRPVWISHNKSIVKFLNQNGYEAYYYHSLKGIFFALRGKVYLFDNYSKDINFWQSGGALKINMWHGIPLKKIQADNIFDQFRHPGNLFEKFKNFPRNLSDEKPHHYVLTTSVFFKHIFSSAFSTNNVLTSGYPRNDILIQGKIINLLSKEEKKTLYKIKNFTKENKKNKMVLYMPTFRESELKFFDIVNINTFQEFLKENHILFCVKLHPKSKLEARFKEIKADNILVIASGADPYIFLKLSGMLITDYSSIYFDYLLLNKPVLFFNYDLKQYLSNSRELYFDYNKFTPGEKVSSQKELENALCCFINNSKAYSGKYKAHRSIISEKVFNSTDKMACPVLINDIIHILNHKTYSR